MNSTENHCVRAAILGERVGIDAIAAAIGVTTRAVYNLVARHRIPFIRVCGKRLFDPAEVRRALESCPGNPPARTRGRPRKTA